ncbi:MAG: citrate synthase [Planctomycetes bacterium]|nr:citrate synthase [Planctomycetota bacterium]
MDESAILRVGDNEYSLPILTGSEGEKALDISNLRKDTGLITYDNGFGNTGSCRSAITFIDGEKGILRYRGYDIDELAEHSSFVETAYLLLYGVLPTSEELRQFSRVLNESSLIHEDMHHFFTGFPRTAHPMGILSTMVASLAAFYPIPDEPTTEEEQYILGSLISQVRTIAAFSYKKSIGDPIVYPSIHCRFVENFMNMMFSSPVKEYRTDPDLLRAVEVFLILHADHEQNCSTSTVRMTGSSLANLYAVVSAGISALWGKRHGGANQAVIEMLQRIHQSGDDGRKFSEQAKSGKGSERLMGFGHRVYKNYDPRATVLKKICHRVLNKDGVSDPLFDIALRLEEAALSEDYFLKRNLYPNVDFYSGLILRAVGIPQDMFTVLFTIGRMPGWLARWREMHLEPGLRIARPRQIYTGENKRNYVPIKDR